MPHNGTPAFPCLDLFSYAKSTTLYGVHPTNISYRRWHFYSISLLISLHILYNLEPIKHKTIKCNDVQYQALNSPIQPTSKLYCTVCPVTYCPPWWYLSIVTCSLVTNQLRDHPVAHKLQRYSSSFSIKIIKKKNFKSGSSQLVSSSSSSSSSTSTSSTSSTSSSSASYFYNNQSTGSSIW